MQLFLATYLLVFLIDSNWHSSWAQNQSNSGWGVIDYPNTDIKSQFAVNIRKNAPKISPFGFNLGEKICTVVSGTEYSYSEVVKTLNNQIWYKVKIDNPLELGGSSCPQPVEGWLLAKQSNGEEVVADFLTNAELQTRNLPADDVDDLSLQENIAQESESQTNIAEHPLKSESETSPQTEIQSDIEPEAAESEDSSSDAPYLDVRPDQRQTETSSNSATDPETEVTATIVKSEEKDERWKTFSNYLLVCLGSVLGLLVITFEQACSNDELSAGEILTAFNNKVMSPIFWIRLLVLTIASFAFISILGVISIDDDLLSTIQQLSRQGLYEPIIAGFLICIVILNFTSSSN